MSRIASSTLLLLASLLFVSLPARAQNQKYVCVDTNVGEFCMELLRDAAPNTVTNFLNYVTRGAFDNTLVHRSETNYVIQAGGYKQDPLGEAVAEDAPVANEFNVSNTRGTVAMAKFDDDPNSATTEWFVNVTDNSATLDTLNGGFTVFARIVKGMAIVDGINALGRVNLTASLGNSFAAVPVLRKDDDGVGLEDFVLVNSVRATDDVVEEPDVPDQEEEEAERLFQCTSDWVSEIQPTQACLVTNLGEICLDLLPEAAPGTVANFLHYVADGDYDGTFIHRSEPGFVVQGGGYQTSPLFGSVPPDPAITNEYQLSNTRGTVAMAKIGGEADSATSQWFFNLADNTSLDTENGGFTVFARVREGDMAIVDQIAGLERLNLEDLGPLSSSAAFTATPMLRTSNPNGLSLSDFVLVDRAYIPGHEINPCTVKPETTTVYENRSFTVPVRMNGSLYEIFFAQVFADVENAFDANRFRIRELTDIGQDAAVYSHEEQLLRIPSVLVGGSSVIYDVRLRVIDPVRFRFQLESFATSPPSAQ